MEDIDWRRQLMLSRAASAFSPHYFEGHQAVFPTRRDYTECRVCPSNSRRSLGRGGLVYHCAELGTFYNLLTPMEDSQWSTSHTLNVAVTIGGKCFFHSVTKFPPEQIHTNCNDVQTNMHVNCHTRYRESTSNTCDTHATPM